MFVFLLCFRFPWETRPKGNRSMFRWLVGKLWDVCEDFTLGLCHMVVRVLPTQYGFQLLGIRPETRRKWQLAKIKWPSRADQAEA